jgi:excinuclease ABC subunit A
MNDFIKVKGAKEHNLKNVSIDIEKNKLVVITGLSGSGKSSLAFDTIYAEGQRLMQGNSYNCKTSQT